MTFCQAARRPLPPGQRRLDQGPPQGPPLTRPRRPGFTLPGAGIVNDLKCKAEDLLMVQKLQDEKYVRQQIHCALNEGPCDKIGNTIKSELIDFLSRAKLRNFSAY